MPKPAPTEPSSPDEAPPPRRRRWLGSVVALLVVCAVGALAWHLTHRDAPGPAGAQAKASAPAGPGRGAGARGAAPSTVGVATAATQNLPVYLDALGTVTPVVTATVRAQVSGTLTQVLYDEGQMVKKGQLLAVIDPRPFDIALQQASGARQRDEAQFENARLTLQRYRTLLQQDSIARQDVDTQAALVKQLEGTLALDRAAENAARLNLAYSRIVAPVAGRIGLRTVDLGNVVGPGDTAGVAVITQLAPIDVEFAVPQDRLPEIQARVRSGARLGVTAFDRTRTTKLGEGVFSTLDNQIDVQTGTVRAKARFANAEAGLFPNQFVNVQVLVRTIDNAVVVPVTALRHGSDGDFVYVLKDDRSVGVRPVTRGEATVELVQIRAGLEAGEHVVTEGGDRLKEGSRVQLAGERPGRPASAASGASGAAGSRSGRRGGASAASPT